MNPSSVYSRNPEERRFILRIEDILQKDTANGNFPEIHHVWVRPDHAKEIWGAQVTPNVMCFEISFGLDITLPLPLKVVVSENRPKSVLPEAALYIIATVDRDGWIVGQRPSAETD